jgi:hypothetical protein
MVGGREGRGKEGGKRKEGRGKEKREETQALILLDKPSGRQIFREIWKKNKLRGLFAGVIPFYLQIVPQIAISFAVFDHVQNNYRRYNKYH